MMTFQAILTFLGFLGLVMGGADVQSSSSAHQDAPIPAATLSTFKTVTTGAIHGRQFSLPYFTPTIPGEPGFTTSTSSFLVSESPSTIETDTPATTRAFTDPHISLPYFTPTNLPVATRVQERGVPPTPSGMGVTWCKTQNTFSQFGPEHCAMGVVRRKGDQMKGDLHSAYIWDASCNMIGSTDAIDCGVNYSFSSQLNMVVVVNLHCNYGYPEDPSYYIAPDTYWYAGTEYEYGDGDRQYFNDGSHDYYEYKIFTC